MRKHIPLLLAILALVGLCLLLAGCCSNDWKPQVGDSYFTVSDKLGPPTHQIGRDLYWRYGDANEFYVRLDREPEVTGRVMVFKGALCEEFVWQNVGAGPAPEAWRGAWK